MKITPIVFLNNINSASFNTKQKTPVFVKNTGVDSVSFSSSAKKPERYKKDPTKGRYLGCCYIVENVKNKDPKDEIEKFDRVINKIINKANKVNSEADKLKEKAVGAYQEFKSGTKAGEIGVESFAMGKTTAMKLRTLPNKDGSSVLFIPSFTDDKLKSIKVINVREDDSAVDRRYYFDKKSGELRYYEETRTPDSKDEDTVKLEMLFDKEKITATKLAYKDGRINPYFVMENNIEYDKNGEVSYAEFKKDDKTISKAIAKDRVYLLSTAYDNEVKVLDCEFYRI